MDNPSLGTIVTGVVVAAFAMVKCVTNVVDGVAITNTDAIVQ